MRTRRSTKLTGAQTELRFENAHVTRGKVTDSNISEPEENENVHLLVTFLYPRAYWISPGNLSLSVRGKLLNHSNFPCIYACVKKFALHRPAQITKVKRGAFPYNNVKRDNREQIGGTLYE